MKRLGKFSGKIYDESYDTNLIKECCLLIPDELAENEGYINSKHIEHLIICEQCFGCPMSTALM